VGKPTATADLTSAENLRALVDRAQAGDASTLPALRDLLRDPGMVDSLGGDLARQAEQSLIKAAAGKNLLFREALARKLELLRAELGGTQPSPLEALLVGRVVASWLQVQIADAQYAQADNLTVAQGDYYQRRQDRAHRRFLSAVRTLALVRRLALPVLLQQINVAARQQVNVGR
jgi:hypothetical protein